MNIPFNRPTFSPNALHYMEDALSHVSGDGKYTLKCQEFLEKELGAKKVLLTTSGTHALELAAILVDAYGAIMSPFTFPSTANAFLLHGTNIEFVDIDPQTLNINAQRAATLAKECDLPVCVVPVHYAGVGCEMECLRFLPIIEDNAHGLFGKYDSKPLGTFGDLAALSFHETKNFTMGEGGALIINDPSLIERAEIIREKGTNRTQFKRDLIAKYEWISEGSSFLPSDILAAYLWSQLEQWREVQSKRKRLWQTYWYQLGDWAANHGIRLPYVPDNCEQSYHMFYLLMTNQTERDEFIAYLKGEGIMACFHYIPLHLSPMGERLGYRKGEFPIAEDVAGRLVRLPFWTDMKAEESEYVMDRVREFRK